jgi:dTDP-4-amino-4,6-dideoxygalactose transaminase
MAALLALAEPRGLRVREDAAHALGAHYKGKPIGAVGDAAVFSFYPIKPITTGQGGMLTTNDSDLAERVQLLSLHGLSKGAWDRYGAKGSWAYEVLAPGFNYVMTDVQAALGIHQLGRAGAFQARRTHLAGLYDRLLEDVPEILRPPRRDDSVHCWHLYPIRIDVERLTIDRSDVIEELRERGIGTSVHFIPAHFHPYFREALHLRDGDFPVAERVFEGLCSLPLYTRMQDADVQRVAAAMQDVVARHRK